MEDYDIDGLSKYFYLHDKPKQVNAITDSVESMSMDFAPSDTDVSHINPRDLNDLESISKTLDVTGIIVDSGCGDHLTPHRGHLQDQVLDSGSRKFMFTGGQTAVPTARGNLNTRIYTIDDNNDVFSLDLNVDDVKLLEESKLTILSEYKLRKQGWTITPSRDGEYKVLSKDKKVIIAPAINGVYTIVNQLSGTVGVNTVKKLPDMSIENTLKELHVKLGHMGFDALKRMIVTESVDGLPKLTREELKGVKPQCVTCVIMKSQKMSYKDTVGTRTAEPVHTVHMDALEMSESGNYMGVNGFKYILMIVDDATAMKWIYVLKSKKEVFRCFKGLHVLLTRQFPNVVSFKIVRADNGTEFTNEIFRNYCEDEGIILQFSNVECQSENGSAEVFGKTLQAGIRTLLHTSKLSNTFWPYAAHYFVYTKNRLGLGHFKGTSSIDPVKHRQKDKLNPRATRCRILGVSEERKGYILLNMDSNKITISRDIEMSRVDTKAIVESSFDAGNLASEEGYFATTRSKDEFPFFLGRELDSDSNKLAKSTGSHNGSMANNDQLATDTSQEGNTPGGEVNVPVPDQSNHSSTLPSEEKKANELHHDHQNGASRDLEEKPHTKPRVCLSPEGVELADLPEDAVEPEASESIVNTHDDDSQMTTTHRRTRKTSRGLMNTSTPPIIDQGSYRKYRSGASIRGKCNVLDLEGIEPTVNVLVEGTKLRPKRLRKIRYQDYDTDYVNAIIHDHIPLAKEGKIPVPRNIRGVAKCPYVKYWEIAMEKEIQSMHDKEVWDLIPMSKVKEGAKILGSKWVFDVKYRKDDYIERFKARFVAQGFNQIPGIDFEDSYSSVARYESIRLLLAIGCQRDMEIHTMDVETAFLNAICKDDVYVKQPKGYEEKGKEDWVCKLKKSLYGTKQASRDWYCTLHTFLTEIGFKRCQKEYCLYVKEIDGNLILVLVYVDDLKMSADCLADLIDLKNQLSERFEMKDLGEIDYFLKMEIKRDRKKGILSISQAKYIRDLCARYSEWNFPECETPDSTTVKLVPERNMEEASIYAQKFPYRSLVGALLYVARATRPDIANAVRELSKFLTCYNETHWKAALRVLEYLKRTVRYGIVYVKITLQGESTFEYMIYSDASFGDQNQNRKSVLGQCCMALGSVLSYRSSVCPNVTVSTLETELVSSSESIREGRWFQMLLEELKIETNRRPVVYCDNKGTIDTIIRPGNFNGTKHIDIRHLYAREQHELGNIEMKFCPTEVMIADIFTKALPRNQFCMLRDMLGVKEVL